METPYQVINDKEQPAMKSAAPSTIDYLDQPTSTTRRGGGLSWLRYPVYACSGLVGGFLMYRSLGLYQTAFTNWGIGGLSHACQPLTRTPIIGGLIAGACTQGAAVITGLIVLTVLITITIIQALPTLLYFHPRAISGMVNQLRANRRGRSLLAAEAGDTEEIRLLVERHNSLSDQQLRTLLLFSLASFWAEYLIVRTARGDAGSVTAALVDSLGFDVLLVGTLVFAAVFRPQPTTKTRRYGD